MKFTVFYIDPNNSTPQLNYPLLESLDKHIEIGYFSSNNRKIDPDYQEIYYFKNQDYFYFKLANHINSNKIRQFVKAFEYFFNNIQLLVKVFKYRPKTIHYNWTVIPFIDFIVIKVIQSIFNCRIVVSIHNFGMHESRSLGRIENRILDASDSIIVFSNFIKEKIIEITKTRVHLIDHGNGYSKIVNKYKHLITGKKENKLILIGFFGLIREYKGLDLLLEAYDQFASKSSYDTHLIIKGNIILYNPEKIQRIIRKSQNKHRIFFENSYFSNREFVKEISQVDLVVLPYRAASQSGLSYLIYELKKPILSTNVGGLPEYIDDKTSMLCDPNVNSIEKSLERMVKRIADGNIPDHYEEYLKDKSFEKISEAYLKVYN